MAFFVYTNLHPHATHLHAHTRPSSTPRYVFFLVFFSFLYADPHPHANSPHARTHARQPRTQRFPHPGVFFSFFTLIRTAMPTHHHPAAHPFARQSSARTHAHQPSARTCHPRTSRHSTPTHACQTSAPSTHHLSMHATLLYIMPLHPE